MAADRPWFVLVGGINGAGKSTVAQDPATLSFLTGEVGPIEIINPDKVTQTLRSKDASVDLAVANRMAAEACEARVDELILAADHTFSIETVLSTEKYKGRVLEAKRRGFEVIFIYLMLDTVDRAILRVQRRVQRGGHDVPEEKIRKRWPLSLANVPWFWSNASASFIFFNDDARFMKLAQRRGDEMTFHASPADSAKPVLRQLLPRW